MALGGRETWARDRRIVSMLRVFHFKSVRVELGGRVEILVRSMMKRHESSCMDEDARMKIDVAGGELLGNMARTEEKKQKTFCIVGGSSQDETTTCRSVFKLRNIKYGGSIHISDFKIPSSILNVCESLK